MKSESEFVTEACSQWLATEMEEHYPALASHGLSGFEIYEALAAGEIA
tara:strand:- start:321 stop:464 length:144 start_codon:yes stop_codon:yes gene_type:complete